MKVYIFRGVSASGKTTISKKFCESYGKPVALLEQDNWRWGIHFIGRKVADIDQEEHDFVDKIYLQTVVEYIKYGKYDLVIEGIFGWGASKYYSVGLSEIINVLDQYNINPQIILMSADKKKIIKRNKKRKYTVPDEEFERIYNYVQSTIKSDEIIIDSSNLSVKATISELRTRLDLNG